MTQQKNIFKAFEGDNWFKRNNACNEKSLAADQLVKILKELSIIPQKFLEIGCCNGLLPKRIKTEFGAEVYGIDPSQLAIQDGIDRFKHLNLSIGATDQLPYQDGAFDVIVVGFCLYLCDRKDLFKIAYEIDRCLEDGGYLIIKDFSPPFSYRNSYCHTEAIFSYKMQYSSMFDWNPAYYQLYNMVFTHSGNANRKKPDERIAITVLNKSLEQGWPLNPFAVKR